MRKFLLSTNHKKKNKENNEQSNVNNEKFFIEYVHQETNKITDITTFDQRRLVFVSVNGLCKSWTLCPSVKLYSSILIMPLKEKWIYNASKYHKELIEHFTTFKDNKETNQFLQFLRFKDSQNLIFWVLDDYKKDKKDKK
eukprot:157628_1